MDREQTYAFVDALKRMREILNDQQASTVVAVYQTLKEKGALVLNGTRINWNGTLKRAAVDLWDTVENNPDNAPSLWEDIMYREGYRIIPEVLTVGTAFALDECGWWGDKLYKSLIANNIWTPNEYPNGWQEL